MKIRKILNIFNMFGWMIGATIMLVGMVYKDNILMLSGLIIYLLNYHPYINYINN